MVSSTVTPIASRIVRTPFRSLFGIMLVVALMLLPLVLAACSSSEGEIPLGVARKGSTLIVRIDEIERLREIRYFGTAVTREVGDTLLIDLEGIDRFPGAHYVSADQRRLAVVPSNEGMELVVLRVRIENVSDSDVTLVVDEAGAQLKGIEPGQVYTPLDLTQDNAANVKPLDSGTSSPVISAPSTSEPVELPSAHEVRRSVVFEVPTGASLKELQWSTGEQVTVPIGREHFLVAPSSQDSELIAMNVFVFNAEATTAIMTIDKEAAELIVFGTNDVFKPIDLRPENEVHVRVVESSHPAEDLYAPFLAGEITTPEAGGGKPRPGLLRQHAVKGWIVFEVPKGTKLRALRWQAGDSIYISS